jgi:hypothetical protein
MKIEAKKSVKPIKKANPSLSRVLLSCRTTSQTIEPLLAIYIYSTYLHSLRLVNTLAHRYMDTGYLVLFIFDEDDK